MAEVPGDESRVWTRTVFAPLEDVGRVESVKKRIASAVQLGLMSDGERLPSEAELSTLLNVSTVTLREALEGLRAQGLVETRRGRGGGSFIRNLRQTSDETLMSRLAQHNALYWRDAFDERAALDAASAQLAAERAAQTDLRELRRFVETLRKADNPGDRYRADSKFHIWIAVASQSQRLTRASVRVHAEVTEMLWLHASDLGQDPRTAADQHLEILTAIENEAPDTAYRAARDHAREEARLLRKSYLRLKASQQPADGEEAANAHTA